MVGNVINHLWLFLQLTTNQHIIMTLIKLDLFYALVVKWSRLYCHLFAVMDTQ